MLSVTRMCWYEDMSPEIVSVVLTGAGVLLGVWRMLAHYEARNGAAHAKLGQRIDTVSSELGQRIDTVSSELGQRIDTVSSELGQRIESVRAELGARIDTVRAELGARLDSVHAELGGRIDAVNGRMDTVNGRMGTLLHELAKRGQESAPVERCRLLAGLVGRPAEPQATMGGLDLSSVSGAVLRPKHLHFGCFDALSRSPAGTVRGRPWE